jgi:p-cumate 2,3-dioxygenase alpha subunit
MGETFAFVAICRHRYGCADEGFPGMDLASLIVDDAASGTFRIHRSTMTSSEIMDLEMERIFSSSWLYVGHDSEVANRGDYRRRTVLGRPLFMVRGKDGAIRVFINSCLHRGAQVCRADEGKSEAFVCFYHGWAYDNCGKLIGIPDPEGYPEGFCDVEQTLLQPPRVESYRGFYFVNFDADAPSLPEYLGEARELMDLTIDSAEILGGWHVIEGTAKFDIRANWKLLLENSVDNYHFHTVHKTFMEFMSSERKRTGAPKPTINNINDSRGLAFPHGHVAMLTLAEGRTIACPNPTWSKETIAEVTRIREELAARYGKERGHRMADYSRFLIVFPNLAFHDTQSGFKLRQWWPVRPDLMQVTQWELTPRNERSDVAAARLAGAATFQGPGGFGTPDDIEALESCQIGFRAPELEWSDASRGTRRQARSDDELTSRAFWREWHSRIMGHGSAQTTADPPLPRPMTRKQATR